MPSDVNSELYLRNHRKVGTALSMTYYNITVSILITHYVSTTNTLTAWPGSYPPMSLRNCLPILVDAQDLILTNLNPFLSEDLRSHMRWQDDTLLIGTLSSRTSSSLTLPAATRHPTRYAADAARRSESQCDRDEQRQKTKIAARCTRTPDNPTGT
ncbi:hypothetical protein BDQ17DRAFT_108117 [Cyathus striatus]|nr:hypothetical protein BDQ17DRAFT_108117 [Cyathus striatus]